MFIEQVALAKIRGQLHIMGTLYVLIDIDIRPPLALHDCINQFSVNDTPLTRSNQNIL